MTEGVVWWAAVQLLGLTSLPLSYRLFRYLPDRGYILSKAWGILLFSYLLWLIGSFRILPNSRGTALLVVYFMLTGGLFAWKLWGREAIAFFGSGKKIVVSAELVFTLSYALWIVVRAYNPQIEGTEKPMDFAFLNAAVRSPFFPPHDPWLSGYSISYYYFGYLMMGGLTELTAIPSRITYNLALALLFALTAGGAFSLVYNLVTLARGGAVKAIGFGLAGAYLMVGLGNLEGVLETLRAHGVGSENLWRWFSIRDLGGAYQSPQWYPSEPWWWWRATRVIGTMSEGKTLDYTITEFPFFSFLLGDLHPHVMALPFGLLALALALNLLRHPCPPGVAWLKENPLDLVALALVLGSLGFINGWDLPTYLLLFLVVGTAKNFLKEGTKGLEWVWPWAAWGVLVVGGALLLYLPFYWGFVSQVLGVLEARGEGRGLPLSVWAGPATRPVHFLLLWGFLLFLVGSFVFALASRVGQSVGPLLRAAILAPVAIWVWVEGGRLYTPGLSLGYKDLLGLIQRGWFLFPLASLGALGVSSWVRRSGTGHTGHEEKDAKESILFTGLLIFIALLLLMACELVYIRDVFGNRMNTIFKLYYQGWVFLAPASAFALYYLSTFWKVKGSLACFVRGSWWAAFGLLLVGSSIYPLAATISKTATFASSPTLDGLAFVAKADRGEYNAMRWLTEKTVGVPVVLESIGGEYSQYGRVSAYTGLPTVLGWAGHEIQWRGSHPALQGRAEEVDRVYQSTDKSQVMSIINKYGISYVYVGSLERSKYPGEALAAFDKYMEVAFREGGVTIYRVGGG